MFKFMCKGELDLVLTGIIRVARTERFYQSQCVTLNRGNVLTH